MEPQILPPTFFIPKGTLRARQVEHIRGGIYVCHECGVEHNNTWRYKIICNGRTFYAHYCEEHHVDPVKNSKDQGHQDPC